MKKLFVKDLCLRKGHLFIYVKVALNLKDDLDLVTKEKFLPQGIHM